MCSEIVLYEVVNEIIVVVTLFISHFNSYYFVTSFTHICSLPYSFLNYNLVSMGLMISSERTLILQRLVASYPGS